MLACVLASIQDLRKISENATGGPQSFSIYLVNFNYFLKPHSTLQMNENSAKNIYKFSSETVPLCSMINRIYIIAQSNTTFYQVITIKIT